MHVHLKFTGRTFNCICFSWCVIAIKWSLSITRSASHMWDTTFLGSTRYRRRSSPEGCLWPFLCCRDREVTTPLWLHGCAHTMHVVEGIPQASSPEGFNSLSAQFFIFWNIFCKWDRRGCFPDPNHENISFPDASVINGNPCKIDDIHQKSISKKVTEIQRQSIHPFDSVKT